MADAVTEWVRLPLPDPEHTLEYDVLRLIAALRSIDGLLHLFDTLTTSDDRAGLGSVQGLVNAVRELRTAAQAASVDLVQLAPAVSSSVTYAADGAVSAITEVLPGSVPRATHYTYDADGAVLTATLTLPGAAYRTTYTYTDGALTGTLREVLS